MIIFNLFNLTNIVVQALASSLQLLVVEKTMN